MGEDAFLKPDHVDDGEFEAFGSVKRHQGHGVAAVLKRVGIAKQSDLLQELSETGLSFGGLVILAGYVQELLQVFEAADGFFGVFGAQLLKIAASVHDMAKDGGYLTALRHFGGFLDECGEGSDAF